MNPFKFKLPALFATIKWASWLPQRVKSVTCLSAGIKDEKCWGFVWRNHTWLFGLNKETYEALKKTLHS